MKDSNFTREVSKSNDAFLIYYTALADGEDITTEYKYFNKLARTVKGAIKVGVFRVDPAADNFQIMKKKYKFGNIGKNKPELRFYPNNQQMQSKIDGSY